MSTSRGERVVYEVAPHHETTLQEAMVEAVPPIAHITINPLGLKETSTSTRRPLRG